MKKQLSIREWQALSAFLDGNLSPHEKSRLEAKLSSDADLREALEGLRRTRILLRNSPRLKAPHNFTLTSQMVGIKKQKTFSPLFPMFKFSTVIASILFVFALLGDFVIKQPPQMAAVQERDMVTAEQYAEAPALEQEISAMPTATLALPTEIMMAEEAEEKASAQLSNAPIEPLPSTVPSTMKMAPTATAVKVPMLAAEPAETYLLPTEAVVPMPEAPGAMGAGGMEDAAVANMGEQATEEGNMVAESPVQAPAYSLSERAEAQGAQKEVNFWRILEIVFGCLIIILGILALIFRSKKTL